MLFRIENVNRNKINFQPEDGYIAVGSTDCMLTIRKRMSKAEVDVEYEEKRKQRKRTRSGYTLTTVEGRNPDSADVVVEHKKKEYMEKYNVYLKKFRHSKALDVVLNVSQAVLTLRFKLRSHGDLFL